MNVFDFLTEEDFKTVVNAVENELDFKVKSELKSIEFELHSSHASCDWYGGEVKEGDYIVGYMFSVMYGDYSGQGGSITQKDIHKHFGDTEKAMQWVDNFLKGRNIKGYESLDLVQRQLSFI